MEKHVESEYQPPRFCHNEWCELFGVRHDRPYHSKAIIVPFQRNDNPRDCGCTVKNIKREQVWTEDENGIEKNFYCADCIDIFIEQGYLRR